MFTNLLIILAILAIFALVLYISIASINLYELLRYRSMRYDMFNFMKDSNADLFDDADDFLEFSDSSLDDHYKDVSKIMDD